MLDHHLQRSIIYKLSFADRLRFSDLKPDDIENKLFTYHLKKAVSSGLVIKDHEGLYALTPEGRRVSTGVGTAEQKLITERPYSVLFLVIRRKTDNAWLLYRRPIHPMRGYYGFMHCNPSSMVDAAQAATEQCRIKTGLSGIFTPLGGGYFRMYEGSELESFTHFTLLYCDNIQGELAANQSEYYWQKTLSLDDEGLFPGTQLLHEAYKAQVPFYIEQSFQLTEASQT